MTGQEKAGFEESAQYDNDEDTYEYPQENNSFFYNHRRKIIIGTIILIISLICIASIALSIILSITLSGGSPQGDISNNPTNECQPKTIIWQNHRGSNQHLSLSSLSTNTKISKGWINDEKWTFGNVIPSSQGVLILYSTHLVGIEMSTGKVLTENSVSHLIGYSNIISAVIVPKTNDTDNLVIVSANCVVFTFDVTNKGYLQTGKYDMKLNSQCVLASATPDGNKLAILARINWGFEFHPFLALFDLHNNSLDWKTSSNEYLDIIVDRDSFLVSDEMIVFKGIYLYLIK